tara:strand:+ start:391 stop:714 length:324 start_codon:yes stop_codon:yes gene_type:complete
MVGKIDARREKRATPGKKFGTTTYKSGGRVKKQVGGVMPGVGAAGAARPLAGAAGARPLAAGAARPLAGAAGVQRPLGGGALPSTRMIKKGGKVKAKHGGMKDKKKK